MLKVCIVTTIPPFCGLTLKMSAKRLSGADLNSSRHPKFSTQFGVLSRYTYAHTDILYRGVFL